MGKVVSITGEDAPIPGKPVESIVALLELYLADAKAGNLTAVAIVALDRESAAINGHSITTGRLTIAGALGLLQHRLYQDVDVETD